MFRRKLTATAALALIVLAGCSGTGQETDTPTSDAPVGDGDAGGGDSGSSGGDGSGDDLTIAMVTHGTPGDTFWDVVRSGGEQAAADLDLTMTYQGDGDPVEQSQLIDAAVAQDVDGLIVSMANPEGVRDSVEAAVAAGIPVVTINSGLEQSSEYGAITHVGQSERIAGEGAGEQLADAGATNAICVIHEAGNTGLEDRCGGAAHTMGGTVTNVQVDIANIADAQNTIQSQLLADPSIDAVLTLNSVVAVAATQAVADAGSEAQVATFDLSSDVLDLIEDGSILFAVDQQPYTQGYIPVTLLALYNRNGDVVGGGQPIYSGPAFITSENAAQVAEFAANGTR